MALVTEKPVKSRPFPWFCPVCRKQEVFRTPVTYRTKVKHDDVLHELELTNFQVPKCRNCGELLFDLTADDQINQALRAKLELLHPTEICERREAIGMSASELSQRLGFPEDTIKRIEEGLVIQSRAQDNFLRVFFAFPQVRQAFTASGPDPRLGLVPIGIGDECLAGSHQ
jgi:ribosome-binding protein aMBF1 (putative translation factor)